MVSEQEIHLTEYKQNLLKKLSALDGLKFLQTDFGVDIDKVEDFEIKCRAKYDSLKKEKKQYIEGTATKKENQGNFSDVDEVINTTFNYLVTGIPTSGKTSFLRRIGRKFIQANPDKYLFYFELNKVHEIITSETFNILLSNSYLDSVSHNLDFTLLKKNKFLILLDGLDELAEDSQREKIIKKITEFQTEYPTSQFVLTSRPIEFILNNDLIDNLFEKYELLPLNIQEFIKIGERFIGEESTFSEYITLVKKSDLINAFPKTPLTSILLCILFKEKQINIHELPANITELYKKFIDLFLNKWDTSKGLSQQFKFQQKEFILQSIAKYMHDNNLVYISNVELSKMLTDLGNTKPIDDLKNVELFLRELRKTTSVLKKSETQLGTEYSFFHLTIQEYLASIKLRSSEEQLLIENYYNNWWLNPIIFYTGKDPDNSNFIKRISKLENYPLDNGNKIKYIINSSTVLTAGHLVDRVERLALLESMVKIFNELIVDVIKNISLSENNPLLYKTILDIILDARNLFFTRFKIKSFQECLLDIWKNNVLTNRNNYHEITQYCISYTLSLKSEKEDFLLEFINSPSLNVRWFKIVNVDIKINKLKHKKSNDQTLKRISKKVRDNLQYVNDQFKQPLKKHLNSLLDLES